MAAPDQDQRKLGNMGKAAEASSSRPEQLVGEAILIDALALTDQAKLKQVAAVQGSVLKRVKDSKRMLEKFDRHSTANIGEVCKQIVSNTELLLIVKTDLEYIMKHARVLKKRLADKYPGLVEERGASESLEEESGSADA